MKMKALSHVQKAIIHLHFLGIVFLITFSTLACNPKHLSTSQPQLQTEIYDTAFPNHNAPLELQALTESIRKIFFSVSYDDYLFPAHLKIQADDIQDKHLNQATEISTSTHSASSTATVILHQNRKVALLSCAHIFDTPDTLITYFDHEGTNHYVQSMSIKKRQTITISGLTTERPWRILAKDFNRDIAIIGSTLDPSYSSPIAVFTYPFGKSEDLTWGSFVYVLGYPKGVKTITRGIVSQPRKNNKDSFVTDALFNSGSSGAMVLAIRGGVPNFELVGIAVSVSGLSEDILIPKAGEAYEDELAYTGEVFVKNRTVIDYGLTHVVSSNAILDFIRSHSAPLKERGYIFNFLK